MENTNLYQGIWSGREVDELLKKSIDSTRPNLLENWYFAGAHDGYEGEFPINQRGNGLYESNGYTIDRWRMESTAEENSSSPTVSVGDEKIGLSNVQDVDFLFEQILDNATVKALAYQVVTISIVSRMFNLPDPTDVYSGGYFGIYSEEWGWFLQTPIYNDGDSTGQSAPVRIRSATGQFPLISTGKCSFRIFFPGSSYSGASVSLFAAKLELGQSQSLAYYEQTPFRIANGIQFSEIPDYNIEFLRCITSTADPSDVYANKPVDGMGLLFFSGVTVYARTGNIVEISDARITSDYVLLRCDIAEPRYIKEEPTWSTNTAGQFTLNGKCTVATTANITLGKKGN